MNVPPKVLVDPALARDLAAVRSADTPRGWDDEVGIDRRDIRVEGTNELNARVHSTLDAYGLVIVRVGDSHPDSLVPSLCTAIISLLARPIKVFRNAPLWREVAVRLDRPANRSQGIGAIPLHQDFVNAERPPEYVFLSCLRADPLGGGASTLIDITTVVPDLPGEVVDALAQPDFSDGRVGDLDEVGGDVNPFPVIAPRSAWPFRYTGHLEFADLRPGSRAAVAFLAAALARQQISYTLRPGDLMVIDQRRTLHGRAPLGPGQDRLPSYARRCLRHAFGRPW